MVVTASGGSIMLKNEDAAWELFENMSKTFQHHTSTTRLERPAASTSQKPRGVFEIQPSNELTNQVAALTQKLDQLLSVGQTLQSPPSQGICALYSSPAHFVSNCSATSQFPRFVQEQVNAAQGFSKPDNDPFSNTFNSGWLNHPNFSWKSPGQGTLFSQPGNGPNLPFNLTAYCSQQSYQHPNPQPSQRPPSFEETMLQGPKEVKVCTQLVHSHSQSIARLETQIGEITNALNKREEGRLPSQPMVNPKNTFDVGSDS